MTLMVTGTDGLLGSAICRIGADGVFLGNSIDLAAPQTVTAMFCACHPTHVIHCAAKVGGIKANAEEPESMFHDNAVMNAMVIHEAAVSGVKHFVAFGSNCAFDPSLAVANEANIHDGKPYGNNLAYGYAKRMIDVHLDAAQQQFGMTATYIIPPSMYGPCDNFGDGGHVVPSLIRKAVEAKRTGRDWIEVWGDGSAVRDVAYSEDVAAVVMDSLDAKPRRLVLGGVSMSIRDIAIVICAVVGIREIRWRTDKPNGQLRRPRVQARAWPTSFLEGVERTVAWLEEHWPNVRGM